MPDVPHRLERLINRFGVVNNVIESSGDDIVIDFYLNDKDISVFERMTDGEFGSSIIYDEQNNIINKFMLRLGDLEIEDEDKKHLVLSKVDQIISEITPLEPEFKGGSVESRWRQLGGDPILHLEGRNVNYDDFIVFFDKMVVWVNNNRDMLKNITMEDF